MASIASGTIFKFNLPFDLGCGYAKLIDFSSLDPYFGITIKVYDYFEDREIRDVEFFRGMPLFMNPIPIVKMPSIRGKYAWKKIGVVQEATDAEKPVYKRHSRAGFAFETLEAYQDKEWYAWVNFKDEIGPVPFEKVRHLEELFWRSTVTIEERVAIQLLRYRKEDVKKFFSNHTADTSWQVDYNTQQFIPLYKHLPEAIRSKPLLKGFVPDEYLDYKFEG
jgi:hypothetical protein